MAVAFKFRLQRVLDIREDELKAAQQKLAEAFQALERAEKALKKAKKDLKDAHEEMISDNYKMPQEYSRLIKRLDDHLKSCELKLLEANNNVTLARQALLKAQMRVEALEKLRDKQSEEYTDNMNKIEQKQTNEDVSIKFARKQMDNDQNSEGDSDHFEDDNW